MRTTSAGSDWEDQTPTGNSVLSIEVDPTDRRHVVVLMDDGSLYESDDAAASWDLVLTAQPPIGISYSDASVSIDVHGPTMYLVGETENEDLVMVYESGEHARSNMTHGN
jgi:hypothetical protein